MQSEIKFKSPSIKFHITVGAFLTVIILVLSFIYRFEVSLILMGIGGTIGGVGALAIGSRGLSLFRAYQLGGLQVRRESALVRQEEARAGALELKAHVITFPRTHTIAKLPDSPLDLIEGVAYSRDSIHVPQLSETSMPRLLDVIKGESDIIFRGRKRSGKTHNAMLWLEGRGKVIVCDPKNEGYKLNNWPPNCLVVSTQREIEQAIDGVIQVMHQRRKSGQVGAENLTIFFDELHDQRTRLRIDVLGAAMEIATLGAEFNVFAAFTTHADTGKYLKIDAISLLENFSLVRTHRVGDVFRVFVDLGDGEIECVPERGVGTTFKGESGEVQGGVGRGLSVVPDAEESLVLQGYAAGADYATISRGVYGHAGGNQYKKIERILRKYGKLGDDK